MSGARRGGRAVPVELVVTDLDGTLSDARERVHPASARAVRALQAAGVPVLLATGRRPRTAATVLRGARLQVPAVVLDGALGLDLPSGRVFHRARFPDGAAAAVLRAFTDAGVSPCVYVDRPGVDYVVGRRPSTNPAHLARSPNVLVVDDLESLVAGEPVQTFAVIGRPAALLEPVARAVGAAGSASVVADLVYGGATLQVRPLGVSKWSGVLAFCADRGLDPTRVLAVGDGANDLELLEAASVACSVAGANPAALARADHVIGPPDLGGWAAIPALAGVDGNGRRR
jgi:hydroxymethylpyrimidine pyrophosphatase-like HAD family hydrolase